MDDKDKRELFIHQVMDNLKSFWILNMSSMDLSDIMNTIMDTDVHEYDDKSFADKLQFELEQAIEG